MTDRDFLQVCKEELHPLIDTKSGASWAQMTKFLYHVRLLRYMTDEQIIALKYRTEKGNIADFSKVRGSRKDLAALGYLEEKNRIYRATPKTTNLLKELGFTITLLQPEPTGDGGVDSILKTDVFIEALKFPNFKALLFPRFPKDTPYLIPDALLVLAEDNRYQLNFLEIETDKFYHDEYLENKRQNYERLGKDDQVYRYWENICGHLGLKKPSKEQFKFRVICIGNIKKEWNGWDFTTE